MGHNCLAATAFCTDILSVTCSKRNQISKSVSQAINRLPRIRSIIEIDMTIIGQNTELIDSIDYAGVAYDKATRIPVGW